MSMTQPLVHIAQTAVPAVATATDDSTVVCRAPWAGVVTGVTFTPDTAITGANTNSRTYTLRNRGQAGSGTTEVATLAMVSGTNATAFNETTITLSGTAANLVVADGDILEWLSDSIGTGLADPGGLVAVTLSRT